jgi:hypothetical protein
MFIVFQMDHNPKHKYQIGDCSRLFLLITSG